MWAALYRFTDNPQQMFRMHNLADLVSILDTINLNTIENRLTDIYRLLTLLSVFQSLVVLYKPRYIEYVCFRSFFIVTESDLNLINFWLEKLKNQVEYICSQKRENEDCLQVKLDFSFYLRRFAIHNSECSTDH